MQIVSLDIIIYMDSFYQFREGTDVPQCTGCAAREKTPSDSFRFMPAAVARFHTAQRNDAMGVHEARMKEKRYRKITGKGLTGMPRFATLARHSGITAPFFTESFLRQA